MGHFTRHINRKTPCTNAGDIAVNVLDGNKCNYCKIEFSQISSLNRHIRENRCKVKKKMDEDKEKLFNELVKEVKELKKDNAN